MFISFGRGGREEFLVCGKKGGPGPDSCCFSGPMEGGEGKKEGVSWPNAYQKKKKKGGKQAAKKGKCREPVVSTMDRVKGRRKNKRCFSQFGPGSEENGRNRDLCQAYVHDAGGQVRRKRTVFIEAQYVRGREKEKKKKGNLYVLGVCPRSQRGAAKRSAIRIAPAWHSRGGEGKKNGGNVIALTILGNGKKTWLVARPVPPGSWKEKRGKKEITRSYSRGWNLAKYAEKTTRTTVNSIAP